MGMGRNGNSLMGMVWKWELVTKLGMGMRRNGNGLHGNGREWEYMKSHSRSSLLCVDDEQRCSAWQPA